MPGFYRLDNNAVRDLEEHQGRSLLSYFTELKRGETRLGVVRKSRTPQEAEQILAQDVEG